MIAMIIAWLLVVVLFLIIGIGAIATMIQKPRSNPQDNTKQELKQVEYLLFFYKQQLRELDLLKYQISQMIEKLNPQDQAMIDITSQLQLLWNNRISIEMQIDTATKIIDKMKKKPDPNSWQEEM